MQHIVITDSVEEMIEIGRQIVDDKPEVYSAKTKKEIMDIILQNMPNASPEERTNMFYRSIYDYWVYGAAIDEMFFCRFYEKGHDEKSTYLTALNRDVYRAYLNKQEDTRCLDNKYETYLKFKEWYKRDVILLSGEKDFDAYCDFVKKHPTYVVKPTDLLRSRGVYKDSVSDHKDLRAAFLSILEKIEIYSEAYRFRRKARTSEDTIILEELIDQDERISAIHPHSVNGIRCNTIYVDGKVHIYRPWLKIGRDGAFTTSAEKGTLVAGIDEKTGVIDTQGFDEALNKYETHPNTGVRLLGFQIPNWKEMTQIVTTLALDMPTVKFIGWDMALSKNGWCVIEANADGDSMWQLVYERGMKKEFEDLIGWRPAKELWEQ